MERKVLFGFLAGAVVGGAVGRAWPEPAAASRPSEGRTSIVPARPSPPPRVAPESAPPPPDPVAEVASPHLAALRAVARETGEALLTCEVGERLPDGPVAGLPRAQVHAGRLSATVDEAEGDAQLRLPTDLPDSPPLLIVRWTRAFDEPSCLVLDPEEVEVRGRVVDADGWPTGGADVGNAVDGTAPVDADGAFVTRCWRGSSCSIGARAAGDPRWSGFVVVVPDGDLDGLELRLAPPSPGPDLRTWLAERVEEDQRAARQADPLRLALDSPELSEPARAVVRRWIEEEADERAVRSALLETLSAVVP